VRGGVAFGPFAKTEFFINAGHESEGRTFESFRARQVIVSPRAYAIQKELLASLGWLHSNNPSAWPRSREALAAT
jgi:hypothetical protein